jgi:N-acetyltransferase 10
MIIIILCIGTGEHSVIMLSPLESPEVEGTAWLDVFVADFRQRFRALLGGPFRDFTPGLAISILDPQLAWEQGGGAHVSVTKADGSLLTPWDLSRLEVRASGL